MKTTKISSGGQVQVPAEIRRRWATQNVVIEDLGTSISIRPLPDDPIRAAMGSVVLEVSSEEARRRWREEEAEAEARKWDLYSTPPRS